MHHVKLNVMHHIVFKFACYLVSNPSYAIYPWFLVFFFFFFSFFFSLFSFWLLGMAPKLGGKFKTRAKRNPGSSSSFGSIIGVRFLTEKCEETYETLNKYRSI